MYILLFIVLLTTSGVRLDESYFYCSNGQKLPENNQCDGIIQCNDQSDEDPDICDTSTDTFRCETPGEVISANEACDGKPDCSDESDESEMSCRGRECENDKFQCAYGGCIDKRLECNGKIDCIDGSDENEERCKRTKSKCRIPSFDSTIVYKVHGCDNCKPGDEVNAYTSINFTCKDGYKFERDKKFIEAKCEASQWVPEIPTCKKIDIIPRSFPVRKRGTCPPIIRPYGTNVTCTRKPNYVVECNRPALTGTEALFSCQPYYAIKKSQTAVCTKTGRWTEDIFCEPSCYQSNVVPLVVHGMPIRTPTDRKIFPWVAGLYALEKNKWEYRCGASLITDNVIITAAHCVWKETSSNLKAVLGKVYRDYYRYEPEQQNFHVRKIKMLSIYQDRNGNYGSDIAVLILQVNIKLTEKIHPACIAWDTDTSNIITPGTTGLVAGWGFTETDKPSEELRYAKIPLVDSSKCIKDEPLEFRKYVTYTSFCAGYTNGTSVCNGDSGSGLMFNINGTMFLEGIVSISPRRTNGFLCEPRLFTVFTKISLYKPWIKKILQEIKENGK
ncbi:modular serine protease-like [Lycorma delicatula]|uniref:modular serine protease-like n=1 Tax=Lycorma delicatula TaxID=130591 RepID=UPI003F512BC9